MRVFTTTACLAATLYLAALSASAQEKTYAERLGWGPNDRVVIFHGDDAGMSHSSNLGTIKALEEGVLTSASIMMPCPWVPEFVDYFKKHPEIDAGLHITLNAEWDFYRWGPVAGTLGVPSLVDAQGYLPDSVREVAEGATAEDVEKEIRAQIDKAIGMGIKPTHIDTHMGSVFCRMDIAEAYYKVGIEKQIPVLALGGHLTIAQQEEDPDVLEAARTLAKKAWDGGLPVLDDLHTASYGWKEGPKSERFIEALRSLKPGITQIIVHCSSPTEEFPLITPSAPGRYEDTNAMIDPAVKKVIEEEGIILTTWRELMERRQNVK